MRWTSLYLIASLLGILTVEHSQSTPQAPEVAVAPFSVEKDSAGVARAAADSSLEQLVAGLKAKGITVARLSALTQKTLAAAKPARWAVLGAVTRDKGQLSAELRLMEVASGDEMVSYFNSGTPQAIAILGNTAAGRIAIFVKGKKGVK